MLPLIFIFIHTKKSYPWAYFIKDWGTASPFLNLGTGSR
jgi:hypothetical protein